MKYTLTIVSAAALTLLLSLTLLTGCRQTPDMRGGAQALLDTVYKGSPSDYSRLTGIPTADLSSEQSAWLDGQADLFIHCFGGLTPSPQMRERIQKFLGMAYAGADYSVQAGGQTVTVTIRPITLFTDSLPQIQEWTENFNSKNAAFAYYEQTSQEYADAYLDGLLTLLTSRLSDLPYGDPVQLSLPWSRGGDHLFTFDPSALKDITQAILPFPESRQEEEETPSSE